MDRRQSKSKPCPACHSDGRAHCGICDGSGRVYEAIDYGPNYWPLIRFASISAILGLLIWIAANIVMAVTETR